MKGSMLFMKKNATIDAAAFDEVMHLCTGWLAYLLRRLGEDTVRVPADALREALATLSCRVEKDGEAYVIRLATDAADGHTDPPARGGDAP